MNFKLWMENTGFHYPTTPELIEKQKKSWNSPFPGGPTYSELQIIPLDQIQGNWGDYYSDKVDEYEQLIRDGKPMPPILLRKYPHQSKYMIRDGTHRHIASLKAGKTHIPALIGG